MITTDLYLARSIYTRMLSCFSKFSVVVKLAKIKSYDIKFILSRTSEIHTFGKRVLQSLHVLPIFVVLFNYYITEIYFFYFYIPHCSRLLFPMTVSHD